MSGAFSARIEDVFAKFVKIKQGRNPLMSGAFSARKHSCPDKTDEYFRRNPLMSGAFSASTGICERCEDDADQGRNPLMSGAFSASPRRCI